LRRVLFLLKGKKGKRGEKRRGGLLVCRESSRKIHLLRISREKKKEKGRGGEESRSLALSSAAPARASVSFRSGGKIEKEKRRNGFGTSFPSFLKKEKGGRGRTKKGRVPS